MVSDAAYHRDVYKRQGILHLGLHVVDVVGLCAGTGHDGGVGDWRDLSLIHISCTAAILAEFKQLVAQGYKEITLLGQNVNSYGKGLELSLIHI